MPWGRIWPPSRRAPPRLRRTAWPSLRTWATGEGCATAGGGSSGGSVCGDARDEVGGATVEDLAHRLAVADGGGDHGRVVRRVRQADELRAITRHQHRPAACHPLGGDSAQSGGASGSASGRCLREVPQGGASGSCLRRGRGWVAGWVRVGGGAAHGMRGRREGQGSSCPAWVRRCIAAGSS